MKLNYKAKKLLNPYQYYLKNDNICYIIKINISDAVLKKIKDKLSIYIY